MAYVIFQAGDRDAAVMEFKNRAFSAYKKRLKQ